MKALTTEQQELVLENKGLAHYIARRLWITNEFVRSRLREREECEGAALYALCKAAICFKEGFSPTARFASYAGRTIRQHVIDEACRSARLTIPRWAQRTKTRRERPDVEEHRHRAARCGSIGEHTKVGERGPGWVKTYDDAEEQAVLMTRVDVAVSRLGEKQRIVIAEQLKGQSAIQTAETMNLTRSRINQMRAEALKEIRKAI